MDKKSIYTHLFQPEDNPRYKKRQYEILTRKDLDNKIHFTSARGFNIDDTTFNLYPYKEMLDWYEKYDLGDVLWPYYIFTDALDAKDFIDEVGRRGLYIMDIWGYVPGTYSNFLSCGEVHFDPDLAEYMYKVLGKRFLGFDDGEQDNRYISAYGLQSCPSPRDKKNQYNIFSRHLEHMHKHLQNRVAVLTGYYYGHYFLKENDVGLIGSECAQCLPNGNLYYSYLRGAGKQYGVLIMGNVSVFNRWGWKSYEAEFDTCGPQYGTSLSLMRRLMYAQYTYNCDILGFESGYVHKDKDENGISLLSPIGQIQKDCHEFTKQQGLPGALYTPTAIYMDFYNGWTPIRHTESRIWGNLPYDEGDYQIMALLSLIYPRHEDSGWFHDETGHLSAAPFGDCFDVLFSDADIELMKTYNRIVLSGCIDFTLEDIDKLKNFVENGGSLNIFAGQIEAAQKVSPEILEWFGILKMGERQLCGDYEVYNSLLSDECETISEIAYNIKRGAGNITVIMIPFGLNYEAVKGNYSVYGEDKQMLIPYGFVPEVKAILSDSFESEKIIDIGNPDLAFTVNIQNDGMLLTVYNNNPYAISFDITLTNETPYSAETVHIPDVDRNVIGYFSSVYREFESQGKGAYTIAPLDVCMYKIKPEVSVYDKKPNIERKEIKNDLYLALSPTESAQNQINKYPTADRHFKGVKIAGKYLLNYSDEYVRNEGQFFKRRGFDVILDLSGLMNNYPDWSIFDLVMERYAKTLRQFEECLDKAALYGCNKIVMMLQTHAETGYTKEQETQSVVRTLFYMADECKKRKIKLYLQNAQPHRMCAAFNQITELIKKEKLRNIRQVYNVSHAIISGEYKSFEECCGIAEGIMVSSPLRSLIGYSTDMHLPFAGSQYETEITDLIKKYTKNNSGFIVLDVDYTNWNEIWLDLKKLKSDDL